MIVSDKPGVPVGPIEFTEVKDTSVTFTWKQPASDGGKPLKGYNVERREVGKNVWITVTKVDKFTLTCQATKLTTGKAYTFRVAAENECGVGEYLESQGTVTPQRKIGRK